MTLTIPEKRQHTMTHQPGASKIEIEEPYGTIGRWSVSLEARRTEQAVDIKIIDRLVVRFTPQEARDFAAAILRVAGD
jgi:hypothetical protein